MSRIVTAVPWGLRTKSVSAAGDNTKRNEYLERIAKYVPAEIIAGYTGLNAFLIHFPASIQRASFIIGFLLCAILTPFYFKLIAVQEDKPSLLFQCIVSFLAFFIWAYATDGDKGVFGAPVFNIYDQSVGGALLIVFSLVSGLIVPKK